MTIPNRVWLEALSEAAKMHREGVSDEDIGKGLAEFFTHLPRRDTRQRCEQCNETGWRWVTTDRVLRWDGNQARPAEGTQEHQRATYCRCSKGQAMRAGHQSGQSDDAGLAKKAAAWGSR